jgi:hypothetical protein
MGEILLEFSMSFLSFAVKKVFPKIQDGGSVLFSTKYASYLQQTNAIRD